MNNHLLKTIPMKKYLASFVCLFSFVLGSAAQEAPKPEFPPHTTVLKEYDKIVSTADGARSMYTCLLYTSPSPRDATLSRMPSSA